MIPTIEFVRELNFDNVFDPNGSYHFMYQPESSHVGLLELKMSSYSGGVVGDKIVYDITVENKGNVTLTNLEIQDLLQDHTSTNTFILEEQTTAGGAIDMAATYLISDPLPDAELGTLEVGESETYRVSFMINQDAIDNKTLHNSATAIADSPGNTDDVTDVSDDGDDTDFNTVDDPTEITVETNPSMKVIKTISGIIRSSNSIDINTPVQPGDMINYSISVENTGDTKLTGVNLVDNLSNSKGPIGNLVPSFSITDTGKSNIEYGNTLEIGEIAYYLVSYVVDAVGYDALYITNSVTGYASTGGGTDNVFDISDDGDETTDGIDDDDDPTNDPTVVYTLALPSIEVVKTFELVDNGDGINNQGDIVKYTITVTNTGNRNLTGLSLSDVLINGDGTDVTPALDGIYYANSSMNSPPGEIKIDEVVTYRAFYTVTEADANSGKLTNTVTATASSPGNTDDVSDVSDDGDAVNDGPDADTDPSNDPTVTTITSDASIKVVKTAQIIDRDSTDPSDPNLSDGVTAAGDIIKYSIVVYNNGIEAVQIDTLTDTMTNGDNATNMQYDSAISADSNLNSSNAGSTETNLTPGDYFAYQAFYTITQADVASTFISNQIFVEASSIADNTITISDLSDDGDNTDGNNIDDPTITSLTYEPELEVTKTYSLSGGDNVPEVGETITYTITVENTGNVLLNGVTVTDVLTDISGTTSLTLNSGPTFVPATGITEGTLKAGETATYVAVYNIEQTAVDLGGIRNVATATASSPGNTNDVQDTSDDGDDTDGNTADDPTDITITRSPSLAVSKTATVTEDSGNTITDRGDIINYVITVTNDGNVSLTNVTLTDILENADGDNLTLFAGPTHVSSDASSAEGTLKVGETATYNASYVIETLASDSGSIVNTINVVATSPLGTNDVNGTDSVTTTTTEAPSIEVNKTYTIIENGVTGINPNDIIQYVISVENTGNVTIDNITYVDTFTDRSASPQTMTFSSGPFYTGADQGSGDGVIKPGETATYMALFTITQAAIDAGGLDNTATFTGTTPDGTTVNDVSDDGDPNDGGVDDVTEFVIAPAPAIQVVKTAQTTDNNNDNLIGGDDVITYTITITNTGNVSLSDLDLTDTLEDEDGNTLSYDNANDPQLGSSSTSNANATTLEVGETKTYTATYTVSEIAASTGSIINTALAKAKSPGSTTFDVTDDSDDGDETTDTDADTDTDPTNDPTVVSTSYVPALEVTKTFVKTEESGDGKTGAGDEITFTITVENTGNTTLTGLSLADTFKDGNQNDLIFDHGDVNPQYQSSDGGSSEGTLLVGEIATYTAVYTITQADDESGKLTNTVTATANYQTSTGTLTVSDVSDDGDDTDGNQTDDITEVLFAPNPKLKVEKTAVVDDGADDEIGNGDLVTYTITIENTGNVTLTNISAVDVLSDGDGNVLDADLTLTNPVNSGVTPASTIGTLKSGETLTYTATYTISQAAEESGFISNVVTVTASSPENSDDVTATSDDPSTTDVEGDPTVTQMNANPSIAVLKTATIIDNGDGVTDFGDIIQYTITIENTGNVDLSELTLTDTLTDGDGGSLTLTNGPFFSGSNQGSAEGVLKTGETASYIAYYTITQTAASTGSIHNEANVKAKSPGSTTFDVDENSDDGDTTDSNTTTDVYISPNPSIEATKTFTITDTNADGQNGSGDVINYTITFENNGNVTLTGINFTDTITDGNGQALTLDTATGDTDGDGLVFVSNSDGSAEFTLLSGEIATYTASFTINTQASNSGSVSNTIQVFGTSPQSVTVNDISDDGDDTDQNLLDDPTVTDIQANPSIEVTKVADLVDNASEGDLITYTITVENTGNVTVGIDSFFDKLTDGFGQDLQYTTNISTTDDVTAIAPGATVTYTADFQINYQAAVSGRVENRVTFYALPVGGTETVSDVSDDGIDDDGNTTDDPTVTFMLPNPQIEVIKLQEVIDEGDGVLGVGDLIKYNISVENTGNVDITNLSVVDVLQDISETTTIYDSSDPGSYTTFFDGPYYIGSDNNASSGILAIGDTANYLAFYRIRQADVDAGGISNAITATGSSAHGNVVDLSDDGDTISGDTGDDPTTLSITQTPSIEITKAAEITDNADEIIGLGDTITYTIVVTNTGNVTLTEATITDTLTEADGTTPLTLTTAVSPSTPQTIDVGESITYTATYEIEQSAADSGSVINVASVAAKSPGSTTFDVTDDSDDPNTTAADDATVVSIAPLPGIEITKTSSVVQKDSGNFTTDLHDEIHYTITVTNTGNTPLTGVVVSDVLTDLSSSASGLTIPQPTFAGTGTFDGTLAVGASADFATIFVVNQQAIDAGGVSNMASVVGYDPNGSAVNDSIDDAVVDQITQNASIEVKKSATVNHVNGTDGETTTGDTIVYAITVENKGNVTIENITLTDTLTDASGNVLTLTSGGPSEWGTFNLIPGQIKNLSATYSIEQAAADSGRILNTITATGDSPNGTDDVSDVSDDPNSTSLASDDPTEVLTDRTPSIEVTKISTITHSDSDVSVGVGDTINYTITVENTGNTTLTDITVSDTIVDSAGVGLTLTSGPTYDTSNTATEGTLDVGESATYSATFVITQQAVNAGGVSNTASVTSKDPSGTDVTDSTDIAAEDLIPRTAEMSVVKSASVDDNGDNKYGVGDVIQYTVTVTNTGNVTLTDVDLSDELRLGSSTATPEDNTGNDSPAGVNLWTQDQTLLPGESATYVAWYIIDDTAASSGKVINTAIATADTPLTGADATLSVTSNEAVVDIAPIPSILVEKAVTTINDGSDGLDVGETILYTITLTNDGNTTLTGVSITDVVNDLNGTAFTTPTNAISYTGSSLDGTDPPATNFSNTLAASEVVTFEALLTIDQAMVDAGGVVNTVSAVGYSGTDELTSNASSEETLIAASPALTVTKTATVDHVGSADEGNRVVREDDRIYYTITITNTGNVTLTDLAVVDALTDGADNDLVMTSNPTNQWTIASLAPGAVQTYTPYYTIGSAAVLTGSISNVVTVTGDTPNGTDDITAISDDPNDTTSDQDPTVVETDLFASITVTKQDQLIDDGDGQSGVGDLIEYTVTVTNTGEVPVTDIELVDTMTAGDGTTSLYLDSPGSHSATDDTPWDLVTLEVGESVTLTGFYIIDTAAFNSGSVINRVVATGKDPDMEDVVADSGDVITSISQSASVLVTKTASPDSGVFAVGDVITYTIKVKNIGNSDLNTLTIVDTLKDLGDQGLVLTTDPVFTSSTDANTTFTSDPNTSVPTLLVGEEVTFTATFAVTQAAIDAGGVKNTVSVTATADDANNTSVADTTDSPVVTTITQSPAITVTKVATVDHVTGTDDEITTGDTIVYTITIANTGNVTLTGIDITDTMTDGAGQSLTLTSPSTFSTYTLAPGATEDIQATYTIEQSAADTGSISNTVSVDGTAPDGTEVSDDLDTPVVVSTDLTPSIEVTKISTITHSDSDVSVGVGDTINYTITVENTGNTTLTGITVSDTIVDSAGVGLTLTTGPTYDTSNTATEGTLGVGESATYSATFVITQQAVNAGGVSNTASVTSKDPSGTDVTDSTDIAAEDLIPRTAEMSVVKSASVDDNGDNKYGVGDVIQYTVTVTNTGNVTLTGVDLSDELRLGSSTATPEDNTGNDSPAGVNLWTQDQTLLPGESATYVAWYIIDDTAASSGKVINTAIATAIFLQPTPPH